MDSDEDSLIAAEDDDAASCIDKETRVTITRVYKAFLAENSMQEIIQILLEDEINMHYCVVTDCTALLKIDMILADVLFFHADDALKVLDKALQSVCNEAYTSHALKVRMTLKPNLHARIKNIPVCPELWRERVPKSKDIGKFLAVEGTVIRTSSVKLLEFEKVLTCSKCQSSFRLKADFEQHYRIPTPSRCPAMSSCNSKKFTLVTTDATSVGRKCKDFQEIKIQEQMRRLAMGTIPRTITVVLEDDLVDGCKPGDDVVIYGSLKCRWQPLHEGKPCDIELVLKANYIEVRNEQRLGASVKEEMQNDFECFWAAHHETPMVARNHILASLCPQIYGLYVVKLAVALVLAGGVPRTDSSGSRVRGEAHLLLVGDPGTGKSQFLKYASKITPRSVLTTGIGSTSAGLTVTAIRDGPHWTLEAGALVLADGGICCIDEFSSIRENDRGAIHEAMEQQTVSVAKAGLVCKLNTRTSVLAATNPKLGKYDESSSIDLNVAIASPLLSRFDIVLVLLDAKNESWDSVVADYVLSGKAVMDNNTSQQKLWSMDQMQAYFCCVKQINPVLTPSANRILSEYYRCHRRSDNRNAARTTIRLLESLIRIAEAHARLMYRQTVEVSDAVAAVTIMESSMQGASLLPTGSILHSCFPDDPEMEYRVHSQVVLNRLGLDDILQEALASTPVRATMHSRTPAFPPESPAESKTFVGLSQVPGTSCEKHKATSDGAHEELQLSFANFEESIIQRDNVNTSRLMGSVANARTSTQNLSSGTLTKVHPPKRRRTTALEGHGKNAPFTQNFLDVYCDVAQTGHQESSNSIKRAALKTSDCGYRSKLQCFSHITPDSSPEIQQSGVIHHGNRKYHRPGNSSSNVTSDLLHEIFDAEKRTQNPGIQTSTMQSTFSSMDLDQNTDRLQKGKRNSGDNIFPLEGKQSIFSLDASAVEEICNEIAPNTDKGEFAKNLFAGINDSQFVILSQDDSQEAASHRDESKENEYSEGCFSASNLFKIDDKELENFFDDSDFGWSRREDESGKPSKSFQL